MKLFLIVAVLLIPLNFYGQAPKPSGSLSGKVKDSISELPVEYANVIIYKNDSNIIDGAITNSEGVFIIDNLVYGKYRIKITFIGYEPYEKSEILINKDQSKVYFDEIKLMPATTTLDRHTVTGEVTMMQTNIDKRVFNVDKSILTQGQSASEVLENIPSVDVDMDGNVSLRGSEAVTILIDGRPSALLGSDVATALKQIPASSIENIEVITNPSAKYDPEGLSGIINIKLKRDQQRGMNGNVSIGAGSYNQYNGSVNLNYRMKKMNLFANYSYNKRNRIRNGITNTTNTFNDTLYYIRQIQDAERSFFSHMVKTGADWYIDEKNTLSAFFTYNLRDRTFTDDVSSRYLDKNETLYTHSQKDSYEEDKGNGKSVVLTWVKTFNRPNQELIIDANYAVNSGEEEAYYDEQFLLFDYHPTADLFNQQLHYQNDISTIASLQADYTYPFTKDRKLETGIRAGYRQLDNDFQANIFDTTQHIYVNDTLATNRFIYDELITAAYATLSGKLNKLSYLAGIRLEHTMAKGDLVTTDETFNKQYPDFFPSMHLAYKFNKNSEIQLSYSRRITRPRSGHLNPFANYSDPQNIRKGNPYLNPEYINALELSFARLTKKLNLITSVYYREIVDMIQRYKEITEEGYTITSLVNLDNSRALGAEAITTYSPFSWWNNTLSIDFYQLELNADNLMEGLSQKGLNYSVKLNTMFNIKTGTALQLSGAYFSPRPVTMGTLNPRYHIDLGLRQQVLKKKGSISVRFSDVFNTRKFSMDLAGQGFTQELERNFNSQTLYVTFTYTFGNQTRTKQRENQNQNDIDEDMML